MVDAFVSVGCGWVLWGAHVFVVALQVLVKEVRVHKFGICPCSSNFVDHFSLVEEFVASNSIEPAEVTPLQAEEEILAVGLWLQFEPVTVDVDLVGHYDQGPEPGQCL